jgi:peptidyl-prolyl cis-trans isomerase C
MVPRRGHKLMTIGVAAALLVPVAVATQPAFAMQQDAAATPPTAATADPLATLSETAPTVVNMILVRVNGDPVLLSELRERVDGQLELLRTGLSAAEIEAQLPTLRMSMLQGMIDEIMMVQRADRLGIVIGPNDVDRYVAQVRDGNGFASDAELEAELAKLGMNMDDLRAQGRKALQQQRLVFEEVNRSIFVSESEITEYYEENPDEFRNPEEVRLEQLVFIGDPTQLADQAAAAARELQGGADLETVGGNFVDATPMADTGTFIAVENLTEGLMEAVPGLPTGSFSDPITTNFGLSIVKVIERTQQTAAALDDVREDIRRRLASQRSQERMAEYLNELRTDTRLDILDSRLDGLHDAWKDPKRDQ